MVLVDDHKPHVEIDLEDLEPVPLTKERALGMLAEVFHGLEQADYDEHVSRFGKETMEFKASWRNSVANVLSRVLPKYGFQGSTFGGAQMLASLRRDPKLASKAAVVDKYIRGSPDLKEWIADHEEEAAELRALMPLSRGRCSSSRATTVEDASWIVSRTTSARSGEDASTPREKTKSNIFAPGVELDLDDLEHIPLTRERVLGLQGEVLSALRAPEFQRSLADLRKKYAQEPMQFRKERMHLALSAEANILRKWGYSATVQGMLDAERAGDGFIDAAEVQKNRREIRSLLASEDSPTASPTLEPVRRASPKLRPAGVARHGDGFYVVVGGKKSGGIVVRVGEGLGSRPMPTLLGTGAVIREVERAGNRMCFHKITGEGPSYGFVTVHMEDHALVEPYTGELPFAI